MAASASWGVAAFHAHAAAAAYVAIYAGAAVAVAAVAVGAAVVGAAVVGAAVVGAAAAVPYGLSPRLSYPFGLSIPL